MCYSFIWNVSMQTVVFSNFFDFWFSPARWDHYSYNRKKLRSNEFVSSQLPEIHTKSAVHTRGERKKDERKFVPVACNPWQKNQSLQNCANPLYLKECFWWKGSWSFATGKQHKVLLFWFTLICKPCWSLSRKACVARPLLLAKNFQPAMVKLMTTDQKVFKNSTTGQTASSK